MSVKIFNMIKAIQLGIPCLTEETIVCNSW